MSASGRLPQVPVPHSLEFLTTVFWGLCLTLVLNYEAEPVRDFIECICTHGFPDSSVKNLPAMQETWVRKIPWRRDRLPTPVF